MDGITALFLAFVAGTICGVVAHKEQAEQNKNKVMSFAVGIFVGAVIYYVLAGGLKPFWNTRY